MNSNLKCERCGATRTADFGRSLRDGWPECCGRTMRLLKTTANIDKEVGALIDNAKTEVKHG